MARSHTPAPAPRLQDYDELAAGWQAKVERASNGEQRWGLFIAHKPGKAE